jgi:flagellar hook-associated protein 1 FlgK
MDMLKIGLSGLQTTQYGLVVASNNIANANTEGYSRQELVTRSPSSIQIGDNYFGQGVYVGDVRRLGADYVEVALRDSLSSKSYNEHLYGLGVEMDKMLSDQDTGLDKSLQKFFTSIGDIANSPTSQATRSVVIDDLNGVGFKFASMKSVMDLSKNTLDKDLISFSSQINSLAQDVVSINDALVDSKSRTGEFSSQLLDSRYRALSNLAEYLDIQVSDESDGSVQVYIAGGIGLITNNKVNKMEASPDGFSGGQHEIYIKGQEVSDRISGGVLGASLQYRSDILLESRNELGRTAVAFSQMLNVVHKAGYTPNGVSGGDLVSNLSGFGQGHDSNAGAAVLGVSFDTTGTRAAQEALVSDLKPRSYELVSTAAGFDVFDSYSGILLSSQPTGTFTLEGLDFNVTGLSVVGDRYRVEPMNMAIDDFKVMISDPLDFANSASPAGSISDNRNSLDIYDIKNLNIMDGGLDSIQGSYSTLISGIGSKVSVTESAKLTSTVLNEQAYAQRESLSGVNIEEEAARILELQQRYSAAAKVIQTARDIFDIFMNAI